MDHFSAASGKPSETGEIIFQHVPITVVPEVTKLPVPRLEGGTPQVDCLMIEDNMSPSLDQPETFDFRQPEPEAAVTIEDCKDVTYMIVNLPSMFGWKHLERDEQACAPFSRELFKYCERKGIDPRDYFFDEMGMVLTGGALLGGMYRDHREYKNDHKKTTKKIDPGTGIEDSYSRAIPEPEEPPEARPDEATETEGIGYGGR